MKSKWKILVAIILIIAIGGTFAFVFIHKNNQYNAAEEAFLTKNYAEAKEIYTDLGSYKDSEERADEAGLYELYEEGISLFNSEKYEDALAIFEDLGDLEDSEEYVVEINKTIEYNDAMALLEEEKFEEAMEIFSSLDDFKDSASQVTLCENSIQYRTAMEKMDAEEYQEALDIFENLDNFKDSKEQFKVAQNHVRYELANEYFEDGEFEKAKNIYSNLGDFKDSSKLYELAKNSEDYETAMAFYDDDEYYDALQIFKTLDDFEDAQDYTNICYENIYSDGLVLMAAGDYMEAKTLFASIREYADANEKEDESQNYLLYASAKEDYNGGSLYDAYMAFIDLGDFLDSATMAAKCVSTPKTLGEKNIYTNPNYAWQQVPVRISTDQSSDAMATYIKIYDGDTLVRAAYFAPKDIYTISLPEGYYKFNVANGDIWFGPEDMFGPDGYYSTLVFDSYDSKIIFLEAGYEYTLELAVSTDGNVGSDSVDSEDF
jgi:tetratricopeptide (TPR) repeat protein